MRIKESTLQKLTVWPFLIADLIIIGFVAFSLFYPFVPIKINKNPIPILNTDKVIRWGEAPLLDLDYCKYMNLKSDMYPALVSDNVVVSLDHELRNLPMGCNHNTVADFPIPQGTPEGEYFMNFTIDYEVNPFRKLQVVVQTEKFRVLKGNE